ncbi:MAG: DUF2804 family protein [[Clostridium] leptum]
MPQEITKPTPLLKEDGSTVVGWASSNLLDYNKIDCAAPLARIKEWDRYTVVSPDCAVTLSIADLGNLGYIFASLTDFTQKPCRTFSQTITRAYPRGRMSLPLSARSGDTTYTSKQVGMRFSRSAKSRFLNCEYVNFCEGKTLYLNLSLDEPDRYAIASADDFGGKKGCFSYRYQVSYMPASGVIRYGGAEYSFRQNQLWYLELVPRGISNQGRVYQRDPGWPGQAGSFCAICRRPSGERLVLWRSIL